MKTNYNILKKQQAFTIVEMLITIIIISIIAGILIISAYASIEKAKEAECFGERRQIAAAYAIEKYASGGNFETTIVNVMSEILNAKEISVTSAEAKYSGLCKNGGVYTITPHGMSVNVVCSVHGGAEGTTSDDTGGGDHYVYNTNLTVSIPDEYYWATMDDFLDFYNSSTEMSRNYPEGTVISIAGVCYIAMRDITIDPSQYNTWSQYFNNGSFMEIKSPDAQSTPVSWTDAVDSSSRSYERGSICYYSGSYYVAKYNVQISDTQYWKTDPVNNPNAWIKL